MKVLIGAVGLGKYNGTKYRFEDGPLIEADYFIYAITQYIRPDHLIVLVTEEAKKQALPELQEWIALENVPITEIEIPNGKGRNEAWAIFNRVVAKYNELFPEKSGVNEVYVDITNGLRSIPVLLLSIARYLQRSRRADLKAIFYGAYDAARDADEKPVYSVDSFLSVLDWASAVDSFLMTGNSTMLADMLEIQELQIDNADEIAVTLRNLTEALDLVRIEDIHRFSYELVEAISKVNFAALSAEERIISELLLRLKDEFEPLGMADPVSSIRTFLQRNIQLVLWYFNRNRYQDAMLVAREWMLTYKMQHKNADLRKKYTPKEIFIRENRDAEEGSYQWRTQDKRRLHSEINNIRNSLAHCGIADGETSETMKSRINNVIAALQKLVVSL